MDFGAATRHCKVPRGLVLLFLAGAWAGCNCGVPPVVADGGEDAEVDAGFDGGVDAGEDAGFDGGVDAGFRDAGPLTCRTCHGSPFNSAPPGDTDGGISTELVTVGAHQSHLKASGWHRDGVCEDCHRVPKMVDEAAHIDAPPAEMAFGSVATARNVEAAFNGTTCTSWCHGSGLRGGINTAPLWTRVDSSQAYCGTCHGIPPPPPHPIVTGKNCGLCHPNASPDLNFSDPQKHINGVVDINVNCNGCHGSANPAPPRDLSGSTDTNSRGVGAHQSHLRVAGWHRQVQCSDCHRVPTQVGDEHHLDSPLPAELTWGTLPRASGVVPSFDGGTCTVYCHGATLGGSLTTPQWTRVDGTQAACGQCHGLPPAPPHPQLTDCAQCHPTLDAGFNFLTPEKHIDGVLDVRVACNSCHGNTENPGPPRSTSGEVLTSSRGVGAHQSHLKASNWHAPVTCEDCHIVPVTVGQAGHIDSTRPADITFGAKALNRNANPSWNGVTCSGVYCHGAMLDGGMGSLTAPQWTIVNGSQAACGTCHRTPPGGNHPQSTQCFFCHSAVLGSDGGFVNPSLHINGTVEAAGQCGACHALPPTTGAHLKHASLAVPVYGGLGTAAGLPSPTSYAFGCGTCHPMNASQHMSGGRADIELANPAAPPGSLKALSPDASYTPGATIYTDVNGIAYTLGTCTNVYCHTAPNPTTPNGVPEPGLDFPFTGYPIVYPPFTLNVARTGTPISWGDANPGCGGCHGSPIRTSSPAVTAMAGQTHSYIDGAGLELGHAHNHGFSPMPCRTCHADTVNTANATGRDGGIAVYGPVPIASYGLHVNGRPDIAFDTATTLPYPTVKSLAGASWNSGTSTCSNVACHLSQTAVKSGTPFRFMNNAECNACHQY